MFVINIENFKKLNYHIFLKTLSFSIVYSKCGHEYKKIFKGQESTEILKFVSLIITRNRKALSAINDKFDEL